MKFATTLLTVAAVCAGIASATLDVCTSNTKGRCPTAPACSAAKVSTAIQAAECSHNTRVAGVQTFAVFVTDHQYDASHGAPYGTCSAYTCTAPTDAEMSANEDCWTFFWGEGGEESGDGTGCIRSPVDGECGCENSSDGVFVEGSSSCV
ncbi:small secreted protein [Geopyxis carbonaria]|nr:small secreted protein [Geopyxis carbonaria]